jgi:CIC family chloride channel protein
MTHMPLSDGAKKVNATGYQLPVSLRNFVRSRETGLVAVAIVIGLISGL